MQEYFASQGGPTAYLGSCMPGFPNLFTLLGRLPPIEGLFIADIRWRTEWGDWPCVSDLHRRVTGKRVRSDIEPYTFMTYK